MKRNSLTKILVLLLVAAFTTSVFAQEPAKVNSSNSKIVSAVLYAMNNNIPAIVESSLFITLELKDRYPQENYKKIIDRLEDLSKNGPTLAIRYKAGLAAIYYNYYDEFKDIKIADNENPDLYFKIIASRIQDSYFAIN